MHKKIGTKIFQYQYTPLVTKKTLQHKLTKFANMTMYLNICPCTNLRTQNILNEVSFSMIHAVVSTFTPFTHNRASFIYTRQRNTFIFKIKNMSGRNPQKTSKQGQKLFE